MKKLSLMLSFFVVACGIYAQNLQVIKLDPPAKTGGKPVMNVFNERQSQRAFSSEKLKLRDLSNLLWAVNGINREDGKRTAPSARNAQDVDVYVIMEEGAYLYDAKNHTLNPVAAGDHREAVAGWQDFVKTAPVSIVLVSDLSRLGNNTDEMTKLMGAVDVGIVCQNINIACTGLGLVTVPRGSMNHAALKEVLKLKEHHLLLMNNPVGYPKK